MHNVLVLVNETSQAWLGALVLVPNDVESVTSICVNAACNYEFVEGTLLNWVDLCVNIQLNLQLEGLAGSGDSWDLKKSSFKQ